MRIKRKAHFVRCEGFCQIIHAELSVKGLELDRMIVVHEVTACGSHTLGGRNSLSDEIFKGSGICVGSPNARHGTKADVLAAEDFVIGNHFFRIGKNFSEVVMRQVAGKPILLQLFGKPFRFIGTCSGNLNGGIADIGHFFESL